MSHGALLLLSDAWTQIYAPVGGAFWSTCLAAAPIVILLGLLVVGVRAHLAALCGLLVALVAAVLGFGMPWRAALGSALYGACFGLVPIGWIVLAAVFLYSLVVRSGQFEVVKRSVVALSGDRRMQALLIAFCFGTFMEGAAGFGTPVAISSALLIGLGFSPLTAAGLALVANTSPVAFGALGTPITTLAKVSGLDAFTLSQMAGRQLPFLSLIVPAWLVAMMSGWRGVVGCWPAILVAGGSFALLQFVISNWHGPELVDVVGGLGSMAALAIFLRFWQPREVWRFEETPEVAPTVGVSWREGAYAWFPWVLLSAMVFAWGWANNRWSLTGEGSPLTEVLAPRFEIPGLHNVVSRSPPVANVDEVTGRVSPEAAVYQFNWLASTGTAIFLAAILSAIWLRQSPRMVVEEFARTLVRLRWALLTIMAMLALAFTTRYSGADATLGLAFTRTGWFYPFFAPLLGWLGVALTGSDTSSNALFGSLQRITATQLRLDPVLIVASNSTGGVMGKMIDAQSIVVAAAATGQHGMEGRILRYVFLHSVALACIVALITILQAYVVPWMVPALPPAP